MEENNNNQGQDSNIKKMVRDTTKKVSKIVKNQIKSIAMHIVSSIAPVLFKISLLVVAVILIGGIIEWIQELFETKESPQIIYEAMKIEDVTELVQIKKDQDGDGYHLEFVEDFEEKIQEASNSINRKYGELSDVELLKKFILADVSTKFPNLGGSGGSIVTASSSSSGSTSSLDGFLFIGDSITVGLENSGKIDGKDCQFRGVVSSAPGHWLNDQKVNGNNTYSSLPEDSDKINGICIMLGTNNIDQTDEMKQLIEKIHNKYPNKTIYVEKILPLDNYDVTNYNNVISNFCNGTSYAKFIDTTNNVERADGIHPSSNGYETLANNIYNAIVQESEVYQESNEKEYSEGDTEGFQGCITIKRITPNKDVGEVKNNAGKKEISLKYVDFETFKNYVDSNDEKALTVFTLSDDMKELITATWSYDGSIHIAQNANMDYRSVAAQFTMPFEYPLIFQITGKEDDFSKKLADLAINSSIEISVIDNVQTTQTNTTTTVYSDESGEYEVVSGPSTQTSISESVSTNVQPTNINAWWTRRSISLEFTANYTEQTPNGTTNTEFLQDEEGGTVHQTTTVTTQDFIYSNEIQVTNNEYESNHEGFVKIYKDSKKAKGNIQESWLFDFLGNNEKTANMVELTKYLFYMATQRDYGVTGFDNLDLISNADVIVDFTNRNKWNRWKCRNNI